MQDEYLREEIMTKGITDIADLECIQPGLYLWQGDIISLRCDAIVNVAKVWYDRMLYSEPSVYRQRYPCCLRYDLNIEKPQLIPVGY